MAPRLKVFVTSDGLTDFVVAATSMPKALAAWGSHQDLFKTGLARETDDPALVKAATTQPGEVLRRPAGSRAELAKLKPAKPAKAKTPSKAALKKVADLEVRIGVREAEYAKARRALEDEQARLARQIVDLEAAQAQERARLEAKLSAAKRALG
jgi:hypothetical protein